jgi:hypothetical protein
VSLVPTRPQRSSGENENFDLDAAAWPRATETCPAIWTKIASLRENSNFGVNIPVILRAGRGGHIFPPAVSDAAKNRPLQGKN